MGLEPVILGHECRAIYLELTRSLRRVVTDTPNRFVIESDYSV